MSFTWRYVVRPDGSLCRVGNLNSSLDNVSDEELARLHPVVRDGEERSAYQCSRCGTGLLLRWRGPLMTGVWMELCPACDAHRPAARFIHWYRDPYRDPKALPMLFEDSETETMSAHGWAHTPQPEAPPSPAVHLRLVPRGEG
ncbi:DUF6300 family protein [Streptomyces niveus]|uniref:DUF6300 family protein n=1 Tax=Streptomyces niveus TaxID=193462 RepID=UPI003866471A